MKHSTRLQAGSFRLPLLVFVSIFSALILAACGGSSSSTTSTPIGPAAEEVLACAIPPGPTMAVGIEKDCDTSPDPRIRAISNDRVQSTSELGLGPGRYVMPAGANPTQLVVMFHGHQNNSCSWRDHLRAAADKGAIAVAMDYSAQEDRQTDQWGFIEDWGWTVRSGAYDSVQAVQYFLDKYPSISEVFNFGTSMGGNVSGFAAYDEFAKKADCSPIWDYWVATEGVHNLNEEYLAIRSVAPAVEAAAIAQAEMEEENGGTIEQAPEAYNAITNTMHATDLSYLKGVVLTHGSNDQTVPVGQSRQMADQLRVNGVPTHLYVVTGSDHVWEGDGSEPVMRIGLDELFRLIEGGAVEDGETPVSP